jgi:prepilin signal peptidase PulO-like enzyme (type II secretory pathway)
MVLDEAEHSFACDYECVRATTIACNKVLVWLDLLGYARWLYIASSCLICHSHLFFRFLACFWRALILSLLFLWVVFLVRRLHLKCSLATLHFPSFGCTWPAMAHWMWRAYLGTTKVPTTPWEPYPIPIMKPL